MTTRTWSGATGSYSDATQWSGGVVPMSGDTAVINSGTVTATGSTVSGVVVQLNAASGVAGTLALNGDTLGANSSLTVTDSNAYGATPTPTLLLQGTSTNAGTITFAGTTPTVQFDTGASLVNTGSIVVNGASPQIQTGSNLPAGAITNNGLIQFLNPSSVNQSALVNATIGGTGTISIGQSAAVALQQSVSSGQAVSFTGGAGARSALEIDAPGAFNATVSGFATTDRLILTNIPYTGYSYASTGNGSTGTLTLLSGSTPEATINLAGYYSQSSFTLTASPLGSSGQDNVTVTTSVADPTTNPSTGSGSTGSGSTGSGSTGTTGSSGTATVGAVYRFFDTRFGTHFFTADVGERNTVLNSLSGSYTEETNGFGDVAQTDANATAVYRFFDTRYGTHFFTASASERDTILSTRPDLTYEPNSTFYEHATSQTSSNDTAVYRFFDTQYGTHFYTGDANEFAGLTNPASPTYRANLTYEGVGFYAPKGSFA